jgi:hypothetical protein
MGQGEEELLTPPIQAILNQTPCATRRGFTPAQLMLGSETAHPLDTLACNGQSKKQRNLADATPLEGCGHVGAPSLVSMSSAMTLNLEAKQNWLPQYPQRWLAEIVKKTASP